VVAIFVIAAVSLERCDHASVSVNDLAPISNVESYSLRLELGFERCPVPRIV
jgi:hypothetical protein